MFIFLTLAQISDLKRLKLPMISVADLGDPFILNRRVDHQQEEQAPLSESEFADGVRAIYDKLEPHIQSMVSWDYYLEQAKGNRDKFEPMLQNQNRIEDVLLADVKHYQKVHCLRFYPHVNSEALWQQTGLDSIAVELNTDADFFRAGHFEGKPQMFKPVQYDDLRPEPPSSLEPFPAAFKRPEHFAYQQEWRLLRPSLTQSLCAIPKELIKGIFLGVHCSPELSQNMIELVKRDIQFRHVDLWQMAVSETHLRLNPVSLAKYVA